MNRAAGAGTGDSEEPGARRAYGPVVAIGAGAVVCALVVGAPFLGAAISMATSRAGAGDLAASAGPDIAASAWLLARTIVVALLIGVLAAGLALPAAWAMRRLRAEAAAALVAPMLLPSFLVYAAWSLIRAPGTALGDLIARQSPFVSQCAAFAHAALGLALWAWPIAAIVIGAQARRIDTAAVDALRMADVSARRRLGVILRALRPGITAAIGLVALIMMGSAVPLHVAQIETYAIVVWRLLDETAGSRGAWLAATPLLGMALAGGLVIGGRAGAVFGAAAPAASATADRAVGRKWIGLAALVWALSTLAPMALFATNLKDFASLGRFWSFAGEAVAGTAVVAACVGVIGAAIAAASSIGFGSARGSAPRRMASVCLRLWLVAALTPGVLIGAGIARLGATEAGSALVDTRLGVGMAHVARFGAVAALAGWWMARMEARELNELRRISGPETLRSWFGAAGAAHIGGIAGAGVALAALSATEIEATVMVSPPGRDNLARHLLNLLHYLRVEEMNAAAMQIMAAGLILALVAAIGFGRAARLARRAGAAVIPMGLALVGLISVGGCGERVTGEAAPIRVKAEIGEVGRSPGQFVYPRAMDADGEALWVIDKTGRVQRVEADGRAEVVFKMPAISRGYSCGVTCGPDGLVYIADTHEHRVVAIRAGSAGAAGGAEGEAAAIEAMWGEYGTGEGQFIYPTDVAIVMDARGERVERVFVSEYGGNDRVSAFGADHAFLFSFGREGPAGADDAEVRFNRPQSVAWRPAQRDLIVTDAANHRLGRFTADGALIGWIGKRDDAGALGEPGSGAGEFAYPYGLAVMADGDVLVAEFGNNRIQRVDPETGESRGLFGVAGRGEGELAYPWGVAMLGGVAWALDSGNNRLVAFDAGRAVAAARARVGAWHERSLGAR